MTAERILAVFAVVFAAPYATSMAVDWWRGQYA